ncbi:MAG: hypothetical protein H6828_00985 [Planctomycetes bacterium]|nr:hypothetical protein [Planctomycetota bacterium]
MRPRPTLLALLPALALAACQAPAPGDAAPRAQADPLDAARPPAPAQVSPAEGESPLPTLVDDWDAALVFDDRGTGVWCVKSAQVFPQYGVPELVALDDWGVCHVLVSYSGKWTPLSRVHDGRWLGTLAAGDVDPLVPGAELYVGGAGGNLYQLRGYASGALDARLIAQYPGLELHTLVGGDLDPRSPGAELLLFTRPGALYRVSPTGPDGAFESVLLEELGGRVRDAVVLPARPGRAREVAVVSRAGWLRLLSIDADGAHWESVHEEPMGMGRLALAQSSSAERVVLYAGTDDGRVWRHERANDAWTSALVYAGPQGVRGLAAGRFDPDPHAETVAVFGYSGLVQLLRRTPQGWTVESIFDYGDKGHWLGVAEADGRNATDELVGTGYGGRVFLLSRPPGTGLGAVALQPAADE